MAGIIKCPNLVLGYEGNRHKGHKWILAFLKPRGFKKNKD